MPARGAPREHHRHADRREGAGHEGGRDARSRMASQASPATTNGRVAWMIITSATAVRRRAAQVGEDDAGREDRHRPARPAHAADRAERALPSCRTSAIRRKSAPNTLRQNRRVHVSATMRRVKKPAVLQMKARRRDEDDADAMPRRARRASSRTPSRAGRPSARRDGSRPAIRGDAPAGRGTWSHRVAALAGSREHA